MLTSRHSTYKRAADDIAALAEQLGLSNIILGSHDWGGAIAVSNSPVKNAFGLPQSH